MSGKIDISLIDEKNNRIEEINISKPKTYQELVNIIKIKFKKLPNNFSIFCLTKNNEQKEINNNSDYMASKDILFIHKKSKINIEESLFRLNYNLLNEDKKEILDEMFNCFICDEMIKNEKPYFCYICQKNFHCNCLENWNKKKQRQNEKLNCPNCRNELDIDKWKQKLDFEENRKKAAEMMNKINQIESDKNLKENLNEIKERQINYLKNENIKNYKIIDECNNYIKQALLIFKNLLYKLNEINSKLKSGVNNNLLNLISELSSHSEKPPLNDISTIIFKELEEIEKFINKIKDIEEMKKKKEEMFEKMHEYRKEIYVKYFCKEDRSERLFGEDFVKKNRNNIEVLINGTKNVLVEKFTLKKGYNTVGILIINSLTSIDNMFNGCKSLANIYDLQYLDTKNITDFSFMFYSCSLTDISPLRNWNVSNGKNFQSMFAGCSMLSDIKPLENWKVDKGSNFSAMFYYCISLSDLKPLQNWNVSNNVNFSGMFSKCKSITDISPLQKWDVSKGSNFSAMFFECSKLSDIGPLQKWNVSKGNTFARMFCETQALKNSLLLKNWKLAKDTFNTMFI